MGVVGRLHALAPCWRCWGQRVPGVHWTSQKPAAPYLLVVILCRPELGRRFERCCNRAPGALALGRDGRNGSGALFFGRIKDCRAILRPHIVSLPVEL
eukprot:scaffold20310_cov125-Isochrysis_galbana.AAC.1